MSFIGGVIPSFGVDSIQNEMGEGLHKYQFFPAVENIMSLNTNKVFIHYLYLIKIKNIFYIKNR